MRFRYFEFKPRPDDIFIVTYPRSGTTWMQMILYQLASKGDMDFQHISQVSPWFEREGSLGKNLENYSSPRIIKSHLHYRQIIKGTGKYIYVYRDGRDVALSYFQFYKTHLRYRQNFEQFFKKFMRGKVQFGSWFKHVSGWQAHAGDENVLVLKYEDLLNDFDNCLIQIINFCDFKIDSRQLDEIKERCSFEFMKKHENKFGFIYQMLLDNGISYNAFLRKGKAGDGKLNLNSEQERIFQQKFLKYLTDNNSSNSLDRKESLKKVSGIKEE